VSADAQLAASKADSDKIELVCPNGHRTTHSLARVLRLNDAWCGTCGADISYDPLIPAGPTSLSDLPDDAAPRSIVPLRKMAALASACESDDPVAAQQEESRS